MKVLLVDDSKLARMAMAKALSAVRPEWVHVEAANAAEALDQVSRSQPDIAVLDFNMPGSDGLMLAAGVSAVRPDMPIAIISANYQEEVVRRASALGATFLQKPISQEALRGFLSAAEQRLKGT